MKDVNWIPQIADNLKSIADKEDKITLAYEKIYEAVHKMSTAIKRK